ncbi:MAG: TrlF family AAA-like ATPase [Leptospirales bacterium]
MDDMFTKAKFWKCALQVNPFGYIGYRGADHGMTEDQYNQKLLDVALENDIKVIGLADHGNVEAVDAIRRLMSAHGIIVFPGFEIATTEKAHFVCLFPEGTTKNQLVGYLGALGLTNPERRTGPVNLGGHDLLAKVEDFGGFAFAAHCKDDRGILYQKLDHVWKDPLLKAVQVPGRLDDLKNEKDIAYHRILSNKDPAYRRDTPIGLINAKDVAVPGDLANPKASCLIKMTKPSFAAFKLAFQDPESRVRLNSDVSETYYSRIEELNVTGGYLDGVKIDFSEHLNAVIGGRGTGKSTLLECMRFALGVRPIGKNAQKQHEEIIRENLGRSKARVELVIRSSRMNGKRFRIARRYGESAIVKDENGNPSTFTPSDLLPDVEIYGQNEIYEIAQDKSSQRQLLARFLESGQKNSEALIAESLSKLAGNRQKLIEAQSHVAAVEDEVASLPKLEEQVAQFKNMGLEDKLKIVPLLEAEKRLSKRALEEEVTNLDQAFLSVRDTLPDTAFLSETVIGSLPHAESLRKIRMDLDSLGAEVKALLSRWQEKYTEVKASLESSGRELGAGIQQEEEALEKTFKDLPSCEGKTGKQIGIEFQNLMKEIERIRPKKTMLENRQKVVFELCKQRKSILGDLSEIRTERSAQFESSLKKLNKQLEGKLRLKVRPESDRSPVIQFLLGCGLSNVGEGRLSWLKEADPFSPGRLAELIGEGAEALRRANLGITPTVAEALSRLTLEQVLKLEELELPDEISIELNTAHEGQMNFRPLEKLSTGQQCTAILHLLLMRNVDPLIMDQPEDNLDNAFIADRIVAELRSAKIARQFIFATHNANIPVFGDAEWIGVFEASEGQALMPAEAQGAIDVEKVRDSAAMILEGGKTAFNQRKAKYGF